VSAAVRPAWIAVAEAIGIPADAPEEERGFTDAQLQAIVAGMRALGVEHTDSELIQLVTALWELHVGGVLVRLVLEGRCAAALGRDGTPRFFEVVGG
jgi:hypothetical protein